MKTSALLLAAYVVTSGSHTYREVFIQAIDKTGAARIECGNDMESCSDLAEALNMERERRVNQGSLWHIGTGSMTGTNLYSDSNIVLPVRYITKDSLNLDIKAPFVTNCHKRCGSDEDCRTAPTVCE